MGQDSAIEWTDHTFNPWIGCTKVSPGCANCYAERREDLRLHRVKWGKGQPRQRTSAANWKLPLKWDRNAARFPWKCPACASCITETAYEDDPCFECSNCRRAKLVKNRQRVFCASLADWLDDEVPIEWLADLLALIHATPNLDWLLLTKRPQNWQARVDSAYEHSHGEGWQSLWTQGDAPDNVWIGTTVEDQTRANERIPELLKIPARVRFLSCEPLLGPVSLSGWLHGQSSTPPVPNDGISEGFCGIHWVIAGGESGPGARPMHPDWARSLRDQCQAADVPFFFKQWGEWGVPTPADECDCTSSDRRILCQRFRGVPDVLHCVGKKVAGRLLDGREWNEFPRL